MCIRDRDDRLAQMWWTPVTPCTGLYIPVFAATSRLPKILTRAGRQGKTVTRPDRAKRDTFSKKSYWWLFRDLLDRIKGDDTGTHFRKRQPMVRNAFDQLERQWLERSATLEQNVIADRKSRKTGDASKRLDDFTDSCVGEALATVKKLRKSMGA